MLNKIDIETAFVRNALNLRAQRQEVLAANLANSDTPNYKARDIDFAAALKEIMGAAGGRLAMQRTNPDHLGAAAVTVSAEAHLKYRSGVQPSLDGNTVDVGIERAHFAENALHYQFLLDRAASTFRNLGRAFGSGQ